MPSDIPNQLAYLGPTFDELANFDPEDLGDDNPEALDVVESAVRQRVKGMSAEEAERAIKGDAELLQQWTSTRDTPDTADYVYGALFGMTMFADFDDLTA